MKIETSRQRQGQLVTQTVSMSLLQCRYAKCSPPGPLYHKQDSCAVQTRSLTMSLSSGVAVHPRGFITRLALRLGCAQLPSETTSQVPHTQGNRAIPLDCASLPVALSLCRALAYQGPSFFVVILFSLFGTLSIVIF